MSVGEGSFSVYTGVMSELDNADRWKASAGNATVVHALEPFPDEVTRTIFLAGPTPRGEGKSWRPSMVELLNRYGFDGHIFVPEPKNGRWAEEYNDQVEWEEEALHRADCIIFWVPRDIKGDVNGYPMPAFTTNDEWGFWKDSGKVVWGNPPFAEKVRYQQHYAKKFGVPTEMYPHTTAQAAVKLVGDGAFRQGGECQIPLHIWRKPEFQEWYKSQKAAGNRIDGARVVWSFRVPPPDFNTSGKPPARVFLYALHVDVHIGAENRHKTNEIVLFRPDVATVVLFHRPPPSYDRLHATKVVLVKEFRSPVRNADGFVYELPGGSSTKQEPIEQVALHEVEEEVGLKLTPERLRPVGERQIGATLSAHTSALYAVELTDEELVKLEAQAASGASRGVVEDTERTYTQVAPVGQILKDNLVDWSQLGMILAALTS